MKILTTGQVKERLKQKFDKQGVIFLEEVRSGTGFGIGMTYADAVIFQLWPSKGLEIEGFEIKVSRNDWLKEIKYPDKSENISQFCDRWWLVLGDKSIIELAEVPANWGVIIPHGQGLRILKGAPRLQPQPIDRHFFMSVVRQLYRENPDSRAREEEYNKGFEEGKKEGIRFTEKQAGEDGEILKKVREFQEASGLDITNTWNVKGLGKAVRALRSMDDTEYYISELKHLSENHQKLSDEAKARMEDLKEFQKQRKAVNR